MTASHRKRSIEEELYSGSNCHKMQNSDRGSAQLCEGNNKTIN